MKQAIYQVDAFTNHLFGGNPAAICPLEVWLECEKMQQIASENNLSETAFYVKRDNKLEIRWFTPTTEVDLCGHATLASAFVEFNELGNTSDQLVFESNSGPLSVYRKGDLITLDFPIADLEPIPNKEEFSQAFGVTPVETYYGGGDLMLVYESQRQIVKLAPDLSLVSELNCRGVIVTAPGIEADFVSRFFAPQSGISEDPVTGSAHTLLTPYWSKRLDKKILSAQQLSKRKGDLKCELKDDRVLISGYGKTYLRGEIEI